MKRRIANRWRKTFAWLPKRIIAATAQGDEVTIEWVWLRPVFYRYSVFQGRFMGIIYSKSDK